MIVVYKTQYMPATDTKGVRFKVTCINTGRTKIVPFAYESNNIIRHSIHEAFGEDMAKLELVADVSENVRMYAITL